MLLRPTRWILALAAGCAGVLALVRAPAAADAPAVIRPYAVADTSCSPYEPTPTPDEVRPFVTQGKEPLCVAAADLDGDGRRDYVLVLGTRRKYTGQPYAGDGAAPDKDDLRTLLVLMRQPDGALRMGARTEHVAMCTECGGMMGDPFEGVGARPGSFTVHHYGGSAWRWRADYTFEYVAATGRWRLASVSTLSYWSPEPDKMESHVYTAPADFPEIDLTDFDYETWRGPDAEK
ncbi:hypothetical protein [Longimicrobium sp.]|uniref:hypothetical protein n=1 Tax=Longimicrobium sp. TaxID=2029185 RepID=UPI002E35C73E|nr:hypothetical protein [Longimicrobium sp.]HEX6038324.1 hypothetical protein [Longimicrobium sp.]